MLYKIIMTSWGGTEKDYMTGMTLEEATRVCEENHWIIDDGYIWDLAIEEY